LSLCGIAVAVACSSDSTTNTVAATPTSLSLASGAQQSGVVGTALGSPVAFKVVDQNGAPIEGVDVTLTVTAGSGSLSSTIVTTDANGLASVTWTLGTVAGADSLSASIAALPSVSLGATALPDAPASLAVIGGAAQTGAVGATLSTPLAVRVMDQYGNAVPSVTVTWADDANGTFASPTTLTDATGAATNVYTLGPSAGTEDVSVSVSTPATVVTATMVEIGS
jgi:adhesin/invasin